MRVWLGGVAEADDRVGADDGQQGCAVAEAVRA